MPILAVVKRLELSQFSAELVSTPPVYFPSFEGRKKDQLPSADELLQACGSIDRNDCILCVCKSSFHEPTTFPVQWRTEQFFVPQLV
jgi:hypothetical protein